METIKRETNMGYDFHRQKPLDEYIVDFFCYELMLAIEIDGSTHDYKFDKDQVRQHRLEELGIRFLRFNDIDVKQNMAGVLSAIECWIDKHTPATSHPSGERN